MEGEWNGVMNTKHPNGVCQSCSHCWTVLQATYTHTHTTYIGPGSVLGHSEHTHHPQEIEAALSTGPWRVPPTMAPCYWGTQETGYGSSIWCQALGKKPDHAHWHQGLVLLPPVWEPAVTPQFENLLLLPPSLRTCCYPQFENLLLLPPSLQLRTLHYYPQFEDLIHAQPSRIGVIWD